MELQKNHKGIWGTLLVFIIGAILVVAALFYSSPSLAKPSVTWTPTKITQEIDAGDSKTVTATFTASKDLTDVVVRVVPELAPYVSTDPISFGDVAKGETRDLEITISASVDADSGTVDGTIQLRRGSGPKKTYAKPLPVTVTVVKDGGSERPFVTDPEGGIYPVNEIILSLVDSASMSDAEDLAKLVNGTVVKSSTTTNIYLLKVPTTSIEELEAAIKILESDQRVDAAATNNVYIPHAVRSDLQNLRLLDSSLTEAFDKIDVQRAWERINSELSTPLTHVTIGIIDTGIDKTHPEFIDVDLFGVETDIGADSACLTTKSHGTEVAGIVGANNLSKSSDDDYIPPHMNGIISGIPGVSYSMGVFSSTTFDEIEEGIKIAVVDNGAQIINLSFGGGKCDELKDGSCNKENSLCLKDTFFDRTFTKHKEFWERIFDTEEYKNIVFVASAGNDSIPAVFNLPGGGVSRSNLITVAATQLDDEANWATFSNTGDAIDIAAPGEMVYAPSIYKSPLNFDDYRSLQHPEGRFFGGTSAAAPMVTGVVALLKAIKTELQPLKIREILRATATPSCVAAQTKGCRLNAKAAVCHPDVLDCIPEPPLAPQNLSQDATRSGGPRVAVNGQHVYVVWLDVDTRETFFRHSANSGTSFEPRKLLSSGECSFTRAPPGIAVSGNSVHVVYPVIVGSNQTDVCYTYSTNQGLDFTTPLRISGGVPATRPLANPLVAADGENVVLAWSESCGGGCQGPYMRRSVNGGIDFDTPVDLSFGRRSWGLGYLIVSGDTVYIMSLHEPVSSQTHVYLHRSADAGGTFEGAKNLSGDPPIQGVPLNGQPVFTVSGSNAYLAWRGTRPPSVPGSHENENIYFRSSSDNGVTWGQYTNLSEGVGYSSAPTIATGNTNVYVSWLDQSPDGRIRDIFYRRSTNSGQSFENVKNYTQALQPTLFNRVPTLVAKGSVLYLFWRDELVGEVDIWYRRSRDSGDVFEPPLTELPSNLTENLGLPLSQDTVISESGNVYIVWTDNGMQDIFFQRL